MYTQKELNKKTLLELKEIAYKLAILYYNSNKCVISFGNIPKEEVAKKLICNATKNSLIKDIKSLQKKLK